MTPHTIVLAAVHRLRYCSVKMDAKRQPGGWVLRSRVAGAGAATGKEEIMNKRLLAGLAAAALIGATVAADADARSGGGPGAGSHGGGWHSNAGTWQGNGNWGQGNSNWSHGNSNWSRGNGNWSRGSWGHGNWNGNWHNSGWHGRGFHHGRFFATSFFVGVPFAYWWGYPYWYGDPYYYGPSVVYDAYPETAAPTPTVRYYCPDVGYYPTVRTCERGWLRVLPGDASPAP